MNSSGVFDFYEKMQVLYKKVNDKVKEKEYPLLLP